MNSKDAEFLKRILATFRVEAQEHARAISTGLIELEKRPTPARGAELIEVLFREAHSLKGAARSVDLRDIESVCQPLESVLATLKRGQIALSPALCDLFHQAADYIAHLVASPEGTPAETDRAHQRRLIQQLEEAAQGIAPSGWAPATAPPPQTLAAEAALGSPSAPAEDPLALGESVRIPAAKLDPLLRQAEEMILAKIAAGQRIADLWAIQQELGGWGAESVSGPARQLLPDAASGGQERLKALQHQVETLAKALAEDQRALRRMVDDHLESMKTILMLPVSLLVEVFPKLVRDLAREQGKQAQLVMRGTEIEIEKRVLEELKDPFIHLMRNCIDHGLQKPEARVAQNKPPQGTITLSFAAKDGRQMEVTLSDDGAGIDLTRVKAAAVKKGLVSTEEAARLDPAQTLAFIFQSGVSTSPIITDISGRGLGLAIVRQKVEDLGGLVSVDAFGPEGTTFRFLLPMTLATFRGVLVRVDEHLFLLPTVNVLRALLVSRQEIKTVENQQILSLDGKIISLVGLGDCLGIPRRAALLQPSPSSPTEQVAKQVPVLVVSSADRRMGFVVDEVLDEQQVLLKGLGRQLSRVRNIAGAAVLGSGRVVPVLNIADLMACAQMPGAVAAATPSREPAITRRILVAEDSITARTLIKNILETAGYQVATAVDGMDAFTQVRSEEFHLVVSDVDMPRMSGFELTTKIRADRKLGELPVVLVTALDSREDRERGIEAGADAYIVKSSFDQSNLLAVIRRLI